MLIETPSSLQQLRAELLAYYRQYDNRLEQAVRARMDAEAEAPPVLLKARLHEVIAEMAAPRVFRASPFIFECGLRPGTSWGVTGVGTWLRDRQFPLYDRDGAHTAMARYADLGFIEGWAWWTPVDYDHANLGYDTLLARGLQGLLEEAETALVCQRDPAAREFLTAVGRSLRAVQRLVTRFAAAYQAAGEAEADPKVAEELYATAAALRHVPAQPPRTFFEALLAVSATRELFATLEGMGISTFGHLDRLLYPYYRQDLADGRLTEAEAADLLARFLVMTDSRFDVQHNYWAETSTCLTLGGCDAAGEPVYNDLTRLILRVHEALGLINPKPQCRVSHASDDAYLRELARLFAGGRNVLTLFNDELLIPAQQAMGKRLADCRLYVNGGCQEMMLPGFEHSAGAHWYLNLPRVLDFSLHPALCHTYSGLPVTPVVEPETFEDVYTRVMDNLRAVIAHQVRLERSRGLVWPEANPCPLLSATLADCLANGRDFTAGGARYSPTGLCYVGFATLADSLNAIRLAVFERKVCRFDELTQALAEDFAGQEALLAALRRLPHYGQDDAETDRLAARVAHDIATACQGLTNERGGPFQPALFSYFLFHEMGARVGATPDGRRAGEDLSQGAAPSKLARTPSIAHFLASTRAVDFADFPAAAVLDLQLPATPVTEEVLERYVALLKTFIRQGGAMLQCSLVDPDVLRHAQACPEAHADLVVRVAGFSAYFVALRREVQDEIISRTLVGSA